MRAADYIIDIGPGAGEHGGYVVADGTYEEIVANTNSLTGDYLSHRKGIQIPPERRKGNGKSLIIKGAHENNLKDVTARDTTWYIRCGNRCVGFGQEYA